MIKFRQKGDFSKTMNFLKRINKVTLKDLEKYGQKGVEALASVTPRRTGETADSWYYEIKVKDGSTTINFCNSKIQNGIPIAIILQYGHGTNNGGWVEGIDYINPVIQPLFEELANRAWKEVIK
jgi:hypothetical protein